MPQRISSEKPDVFNGLNSCNLMPSDQLWLLLGTKDQLHCKTMNVGSIAGAEYLWHRCPAATISRLTRLAEVC